MHAIDYADFAWVVFAAAVGIAYRAGGIVGSNVNAAKTMKTDISEMKQSLIVLNEKFDVQFTTLRDRVVRIETILNLEEIK